MKAQSILFPLALTVVGTMATASVAFADEAPAAAGQPAAAAPAAETSPVTVNVNLVSDYRFRGIDQTWGKPAVQGGVDFAAESGIYLGAWSSNVSGNSYPGGSQELDLYGGYNGKINDDWSYTVGAYGYVYPGANFANSACPSAAYATPCKLPNQSLNTLELNAGVTWKWISYKLSVATGDYFGANQSTGYSKGTAGTTYQDITVTVPLADDLTWSATLATPT